MTTSTLVRLIAIILGMTVVGHAQQQIGVPVPSLGAGPFVFDTAEQHKIRVSVVVRGLSHPWSIAFLPDGAMLIPERSGQLRMVRNGVLDPQPIAGVPRVRTDGNGGLMDVALHPRFAENRLVYLTYTKPVENGKGTPSFARGRLEGHALTDVKDIVVPDAYDGNGGLNGRVAFGRDGMVYFSTGGNIGKVAQDPSSLRGKILRLRDDGTVPHDNPFVNRAGYRPEIYTLGHRNTLALIVHPETGVLWNNENGPNGGDEINIILPGRNYGWPVVSFGRDYPGRASPSIRRRRGWSRRWWRGFRRLPRPAWRSTPATAFPHGRAMSWSAACALAGSLARATSSRSCSTPGPRSCAANRC
jgi:glucose/arabinose dehydrogenase